MPSFPTYNKNYHYFLFFHEQSNEEKENTHTATHYFTQFVKVSIILIAITVLSTSWLPVIQYLYEYHSDKISIAGSLAVKYTMCTIYTTITTFIILICLVEVNDPTINYLYNIIKESKNHILWIAVFFISLKTICCLLPLVIFHLYESHTQFVANLGKICFYMECEAYSAVYLLFDLIYPGLLPTFIFILTNICLCRKYIHHNASNLQLSLLNNNDSEEMISSDDYDDELDDPLKYKIYPYLFMFVWSISWFCSFVYGWINIGIFRENFELMYWIFLIETSFFKWISKKLARKCDKLRSINSNKNYFISLEYMTEWYYSYLYWFGLRDLVLFNTLTINQFVKTLSIHLISEISQSVIRFTKFYYIYSKKLIKKIQANCNCPMLVAQLSKDDSTLLEWRNRMSMDIILRFYASVISGIVVAFMLIAMGNYGFQRVYEVSNDYYTVQYYNLFATSVEFVYYILILFINHKMNAYNMIYLFVKYVNLMTTKHKCFVLLPFIGISNIMFVLWYD